MTENAEGGRERPCPVCGTGMYQPAAPGVWWCDDCGREYWREGNGWWRCGESGEPENVKAVTDGGVFVKEHKWPDCLERIRPYHEVRHDLREVIGWLREVDDTLHGLEWQAAGGLGTASRERAVESIDAQIGNLQTLREQVEELDDPRSLHTASDQSEGSE